MRSHHLSSVRSWQSDERELTGNDDFHVPPDGSLSVLGDAREVADVLLADAGYPQLGAVVGHGQVGRRLHRFALALPQQFGCRRPFGQADQDDRVAQRYVHHVVRYRLESRRGCKNATTKQTKISLYSKS